MDTPFNVLQQRSSMMNTCWLLQACIVVAVGVGLVSCTKEHKAQVWSNQRRPFSL